jgi:hypothetical protein
VRELGRPTFFDQETKVFVRKGILGIGPRAPVVAVVSVVVVKRERERDR